MLIPEIEKRLEETSECISQAAKLGLKDWVRSYKLRMFSLQTLLNRKKSQMVKTKGAYSDD